MHRRGLFYRLKTETAELRASNLGMHFEARSKAAKNSLNLVIYEEKKKEIVVYDCQVGKQSVYMFLTQSMWFSSLLYIFYQ